MNNLIPGASRRGRNLGLAAAFLGWLCAGVEMGLGPLVARPAFRQLLFPDQSDLSLPLSPGDETQLGAWFAWYLCAFLLGAAVGGPLFGLLGDRRGRVQAMSWSILTFSLLTGACWWAQTPQQLLVLRFLASLGIGGMWPAAVALLSESWPEASRPAVAGVLGTAANVGILLMALIGQWLIIAPDSWRWAMLVGAAPALLCLFVWSCVPESPGWLARQAGAAPRTVPGPLAEIFRPPLLRPTLFGILLGTIPLLGTWASGKWLIPWADANGAGGARTQAAWAVGAVLGSAAGGALANLLGRRLTYFLISLGSLAINLTIYRVLHPGDRLFLPAVFLLGLIATVFFGWLPLYLPKLFPTRVRATGAGVTYNFGRIASAAGVLGAGSLMSVFQGDYAQVGAVTAWIYALGMLVILFAPDTSSRSVHS
jgi:SHS family sialic acid transporter-like MFS transporter